MTGNVWLFNNEEVDEIAPFVGFVYLITNLVTGRKYIGKKVAFFQKTKMKKGKKIKYKEDSDWKTYYGSNDELIADIATHGHKQFRREILKFCRTKGEMTYFETKFIFDRDALLKEEYYNSWVMCRVRSSHLKSLMK